MAPGKYPPLSRRHKLIFAASALLFLVLAFLLAAGRMQLIGWWLGNCYGTAQVCSAADAVIDYWWLGLLAIALLIAGTAHWLTRDRLGVRGSKGDAPGHNLT